MVSAVRVVLASLALLLGGCQWLVSLDDLSGGADAGIPCPMDLTSDRLNCGACGHSCLGGDCVQSRCQPTSIAENQPGPLGIDVSDHHVYWVNQSPPGLVRWSKDGSGTRQLGSPTDLITEPFDIAADAGETFVYWSELTTAQIYRKPMAGGPKQMVGIGGPGQAAFLALDGTQLYVTDRRPDMFGTVATDKVLYHEMDTIGGLAVKDGVVYWALQTTGKLMAGPTAGAPSGSVVIDTAPGKPMGVAVDESSLFWVEDGQRIKQAPKRGGAPVMLYESPQSFGDSDIAVDATAIYWTEHGTGMTGVVRRLAR
jgi:hypothetical protein